MRLQNSKGCTWRRWNGTTRKNLHWLRRRAKEGDDRENTSLDVRSNVGPIDEARCDAEGAEERIGKSSRARWTMERVGPTLVLLGCAASTVAGVGLVDDTEPLFAEAARQMRLTGDWITPQFNGQTRFDKPPLLYWILSWFVMDRVECTWTLRIPSMLCAIVTAVATQNVVEEFGTHVPGDDAPRGRKDLNLNTIGMETKPDAEANDVEGIVEDKAKKTRATHNGRKDTTNDQRNMATSPTTMGIMAALAFATNIGQIIWGSAILSDMLLVSTYSLCTLFVFKGYAASRPEKPKHKHFLLAALMGGMALLAKGPVGILLPTLTSITFLGWTGELWTFARWEMPWMKALGVCLGVGLPWFAAMYARHGHHYLNTFFGYHNFERYANGVNWHGGRPWWYSFTIVFLLYSPWTASAVHAVWTSKPWGRLRWKRMPRKDRLLLFCVCWLLSAFGLFAFSASQLPSYYLPCAVPVAILAAHGNSFVKTRSSFFAPLLTFLVLSVAVFLAPTLLLSSGDAATASLGKELAQQSILKWGPLLVCLSSTVLFFSGGDRVLGFPKVFVGSLVGFLILVLTVVGPSLRVVDSSRQAPLRELSSIASSLRRKDEPLVMVGPCMPSVVYYSRSPVAFFDGYDEALQEVETSGVQGRLASALILVDEHQFNGEKTAPAQELARAGGYVLVRRETRQA